MEQRNYSVKLSEGGFIIKQEHTWEMDLETKRGVIMPRFGHTWVTETYEQASSLLRELFSVGYAERSTLFAPDEPEVPFNSPGTVDSETTEGA